MYQDKSICVVVPAYNESSQIGQVLTSMPDFVDKIVVVDDCCKDDTAVIVRDLQSKAERIEIICHETNKGVGAAIASGYIWARDNAYDVTAVMAGDGQMDPLELDRVIGPVADGSADYVKGNR